MMPLWLEMSSDGTEGGKKALRVFGGLESPHLLFAQSRGLMRIFRTIVQSFVLPMLHPWQDLTFCRLFVALALHQDVQHVAILIYGPPEIVRFPADLQIDLIQVPFVATMRAAT